MTPSSPGNLPSLAQPRDLTAEELAALKAGAATAHTVSPTDLTAVLPPVSGQATPSATPVHPTASAVQGATTWNSDSRVSALWTINQDRNSWVYITSGGTNVGWEKLSTASESGTIALTVLAGHAKELQRRFDYRQEGDGEIHEIYVW